jgi:hypothetical protein
MIKKKRCRLTECERDALRADIVEVLRRDGINPSDSQWPDFWEQDELKEWVESRAGALNMEPATFCKQVAKVAYDCIFVVGRKRAREEEPQPIVDSALAGNAEHQNAAVINPEALEDIILVDDNVKIASAVVLHQHAVNVGISSPSYSSSEDADEEKQMEMIFREITQLCLEEIANGKNETDKFRLKKLRLEWLDYAYGRKSTKRKVHHYSAIRV